MIWMSHLVPDKTAMEAQKSHWEKPSLLCACTGPTLVYNHQAQTGVLVP